MGNEIEFKSIDRHFGRFISRLVPGEVPEVGLVSELLSMATRGGHGCIDLRDWADSEVGRAGGPSARLPDLQKLLDLIRHSGVSGSGPGETPLVLEDRRLYLRRYWEYENDVAQFINNSASRDNLVGNTTEEHESLNRLFPEKGRDFLWHRLAALASLRRSFVVITGGPGTGKTTTVARIMALLVECSGNNEMKIALAAPTGKAVMRLQTSVAGALTSLNCSPQVIEKITLPVKTIHRLLGVIKDSPYFKYNRQNRLPYDLVVIDEVSMVDLPLMAKLVCALPDHCRLIILGDSNQLSSVEPGSVLGDICLGKAVDSFTGKLFSGAGSSVNISGIDVARDENRLRDSLVELRKNFRFNDKCGVGKIAGAIRNRDIDETLRLVMSQDQPDVIWREIDSGSDIEKAVNDLLDSGKKYLLEQQPPEQMLLHIGETQVLCALRNGPRGVVAMNRLIQEKIAAQRPELPDYGYYAGLPVMVNRNDYQLGLFNGDTGVVAGDPDENMSLRAFFPAAGGALRSFRMGVLPPYEACYAMTVHKSQGSEFDEVILVLPDRYSPVLTRELIYTAVSRARKRLQIWGCEDVFREAMNAKLSRRGGLARKLWGGNSL